MAFSMSLPLEESHLPILYSFVLFSLCVLAIIYKRRNTDHKEHLPAGPRGWPVVGNLLSMTGHTDRERWDEWRRVYGPIYTINLGTKSVVVVSDFDGLHESYMRRGHDLSSKPSCPSMQESSNGYKDIRLAPLTDRLVIQRRMAMEAIAKYMRNDTIGHIVGDAVQTTVTDMLTPTATDNNNGPVPDIHRLAHLTAIDIHHRVCFGENLCRQNPKTGRLIEHLNRLNENFGTFTEDVFPFLMDIWPGNKFRSHRVDSKYAEDYVHQRYRTNKVTTMDWSAPSNLTQTVIAVFKDNVDFSFELIEMHTIKVVCDLFYGGIAPTYTTVLWAIYLLCAYPETQQQIYNEIEQVVGPNPPTRQHTERLVYTQAFIQEVWRLYPTLPLGLTHTAHQKTKVKGYTIPKNTKFVVDYHTMHRDPKRFPDPDALHPERFLTKDGNDLIKDFEGYSPFSLGPRGCIGEKLAREIVLDLLVGLVQKVKLSFPEGHQVDLNRFKDTFYTTPQEFPVIVTSRE